MANITASDVNKLRQATGAGMMDCKAALIEAEGDFDKAIEVLRKKGQKVAAKRADRDSSEGAVIAKVNGNNTVGAIISLNCETDFVAKNEGHIQLTKNILDVAMAKQPENKEALLALTLADGRTVADHITDRTGTTGEKMELGAYEFVKAEHTISYIHPGNKLAVVAAFNEAVDQEMARSNISSS